MTFWNLYDQGIDYKGIVQSIVSCCIRKGSYYSGCYIGSSYGKLIGFIINTVIVVCLRETRKYPSMKLERKFPCAYFYGSKKK